MIAAGYLLVCIAVAIYGRNSRIGFWGVLLFSAILTPVLLFYGLMGLAPVKKENKVPLKKSLA